MFFLISIPVVAQTGIGTSTPHPSAKLEVASTNKGFLPPRVTLTAVSDAITIPSPAIGLLVYNTGTNVNLAAGYYYWNGSAWLRLINPADNVTNVTGTVAVANGGTGSSTQNFVDLTTAQTVAGAKTFSGNTAVSGSSTLTVGTGATALGGSLAVTGNSTVGGTLGVTGATTLASAGVTNNATVGGNLTVTGNVGIGTSSPQSTLDIRGSQAQNYTATSSTSYTVLSTNNVIDLTLAGTQTITNFTASASNLNRILTIVNNTNVATKTISSYINNLGTTVTTIPANSTLIIQSTGSDWKQINGFTTSSNTVITTTNGNGTPGQLLSSNGNGTYTWVSGPYSLRVLSNPGGTLYTQNTLQTLYNNVTGLNAPDVIPIEVINAANARNNTNWKVYLGHSTWWYTAAQTGTTSSWVAFSVSGKSDFSANIDANGLFTFK